MQTLFHLDKKCIKCHFSDSAFWQIILIGVIYEEICIFISWTGCTGSRND
jgi:hypothetical protein